MVKLKSLHSLSFLILLVLLPCVFFSVAAEFSRDIKDMDSRSSLVLGGETSGSEETTLFISESLLLYGRPPAQNRMQLTRLWRQFLALIILALFLKAFSKITLRKYYFLHNYFPQEFFHSLAISLLFGGRAPPRSVY